MSINGASLSSLWNNPTLLQQMFPTVNVVGLDAVLQTELGAAQAPLNQIQQDLTTLSSESKAWSSILSALQSLQQTAQTLALPATFQATAAPVSSNNQVVTATGSGAPAGTYTIQVTSLEQNSTAQSTQVFASATSALGLSGNITITVGTTTITVPVSTSDSLTTIANNITTAAASQLSGTTITAVPLPTTGGYVLGISGNASYQLGSTVSGLSFTTPTAYQPATYTLNGVTNTANSNTIQGALPGITLNLQGVGTAQLTITSDLTGISNQIQSFVNGIQSTLQTIDQYVGKGDVLEGNPELLSLENQLVALLTAAVPGQPAGYTNLSDLGVSVSYDSTTQTRQININTSALSTALQNNLTAVQQLFTQAGTGLANQLNTLLTNYTQPIGVIPTEQSLIQTETTDLQNQESAMQAYVNQEQQNLQNEFTAALQQMISASTQLQWLQSWINQTYSSSGSGTGSSSSPQGG